MEQRVTSLAVLLAEALLRRADGHVLACKDDPKHRLLGFIDRTTGNSLMLSLTDANKTKHELPKRAVELFGSTEGRHQLFEGAMTAAPGPLLVPPVHVTERPLRVSAMADAFSLVEQHDQMVVTVEIHPDDLAELREDEQFEAASGPADGNLGGKKLWGSALVPTTERRPGSVLLVGHEGQAGVIEVAEITRLGC